MYGPYIQIVKVKINNDVKNYNIIKSNVLEYRYIVPLTHISLASIFGDLGKQCTDQTPQNAVSDQGLHCLHTGYLSKLDIKKK